MTYAACWIMALMLLFSLTALGVRRIIVHSYRGLLYILLSFFFFFSIFLVGFLLVGGAR